MQASMPFLYRRQLAFAFQRAVFNCSGVSMSAESLPILENVHRSAPLIDKLSPFRVPGNIHVINPRIGRPRLRPRGMECKTS